MNKETRVYYLDIDNELNFSAENLQDWKIYEERHMNLLEEAKHFISLCEDLGQVYSLLEFQNVLNYEEFNSTNYYIYITDNY